jgi:hypothetical protein
VKLRLRRPFELIHQVERQTDHGFRATIDSRDIFVLYGNAGETFETAFIYNGTVPQVTVVSGTSTPKMATKNGALVLQYTTTGSTVVTVGNEILLYILGQFSSIRDSYSMHYLTLV